MKKTVNEQVRTLKERNRAAGEGAAVPEQNYPPSAIEASSRSELTHKEWEAALNAIHDPVFMHDREYRVIRGNLAYARRAGMSVRDVIGKPYWQVFPRLDGPLASCKGAMHRESDKEVEEEIRVGDELFLSRSFVVKDRAGDYLYSFHILENITERKRAEAALRESEQKFHAMSASAQDAIIMIDNMGNVTFWNSAAEKILGYSNQEAMGRNLHDMIAPQRFHGAHRKGFERFRQTGEGAAVGKTLELIAHHQDGSEFPVELSLSAVNIGNRWHAIGIIRDIAERKQAEFELQKSHDELQGAYRKLQDAQSQLLQSEKMASIGQLAAGVAHEINNPIGYVYSNLGSLKKYLEDIFAVVEQYEKAEPLLAQHPEALAAIGTAKKRADLAFLKEDTVALMSECHEGITRVKKIVQDLKDFSHAGSDEEWQWADLRSGLDSTLNIVWNELKYKCEVKKEYAEIPDIECLPSQLNQVFMNMLVNAAHAIEEKGIVTIRTGAQDDKAWVEISDTGKGIAPEHINRIFEPFFTTKPVGKGTGLGLSLSYSIVQKHHGSIEVKSEPGKGTTFRIVLPLKQPETAAEAANDGNPAA